MTATLETESKSPSRRAVLAGALGGIAALAATVIGRASPVLAEGQAVVVGGEYGDATSVTKISNLTNSETVLFGLSSSGIPLYGQSTSGVAVYGSSSSNAGLIGTSSSYIGAYGNSTLYVGVYGNSSATDQPATLGRSIGNSTGVQGYSGDALPAPKAKTGVYGYAAQDNTSNGVFGESPAGRAIAGYSSSGYAGYFSGRVFTSRWMEFAEVTTPASPSANRARLFVRDSGGKTQLAVKFPNGTVRVLATEA